MTFTLRDGVKWSDGQPLTADDVVYTFDLQKKIQGGFDYLAKVSAVDAHTVPFDFNKAYSPGLYEVGQQVIAPKHVWSKIADPAKATNDNPVGTGPYTQVSHFQTQSFELDKNPNYWQPDKQQINGIRCWPSPATPAQPRPAERRRGLGRPVHPQHPEHLYRQGSGTPPLLVPPTGGTINWQLNTTKAPFNDPVSARH